MAEEAALTAELMGNRVEPLYDAGWPACTACWPSRALCRQANVVIVVAGMEGALPSVVGGLVGRPVIAVPTSVGYGASFGGLAALLAMLNCCARRGGGQHRQRLRRRLPGRPDQPARIGFKD